MVGFLLAGAAIGARDSSNMNVQAQNQMEMERMRNNMNIDREALRMKYEEKRYQQQRDDAIEGNKAKMAFDEARYQRDRSDKLTDRETENKMKMQIEGMKESGRNARFGQRQSLLRENPKSGGSSKGIVLPSGDTFTPSSPEYRLAVDMVKSGDAPDINSAIRIVLSKGLVSQAAGSVQGLTEGAVPTARKMSGELFGSQNQQAQEGISFVRDPKTGKLRLQ